MYDNSFWASGTGSWGTIQVGSDYPVYGGFGGYGGYGYPAPYPGAYPQPGVSGVFGLDSTIVLIGAVVVVLLLLK